MKGFAVEDDPVEHRNGGQIEAERPCTLEAVAQLLQLLLPFLHQLEFPGLQRQQLGDQQLLRCGGHLLCAEFLIQLALMGRVLIDEIQVVLMLHDPVGVECAADDVHRKIQRQGVLLRLLGRRRGRLLPVTGHREHLHARGLLPLLHRRFLLERVVGIPGAALLQHGPGRDHHLLLKFLYKACGRPLFLQLVIGGFRKRLSLCFRLDLLNDLFRLVRQLDLGDHRLPKGLRAGRRHGVFHPRLIHKADLCLGRVDVHVHLLLGDGDIE